MAAIEQGNQVASGMIRAAIYARYSTDSQVEQSIDSQVASCRELAEKKGLTVTRVFSDSATSGALHDRPGLKELQEAAERKEIDAVIVDDLSRLARNQLLICKLKIFFSI